MFNPKRSLYLCAVIMAKSKPVKDGSTEEKILEAARKVFMKKGYAATRTRDIAEEAGINLALLNYYFRSKEKLFDLVMLENLQQFMLGLKSLINNTDSSLEEKIEKLVSDYIDMLTSQPDLPIFILSELRANPEKLVANMGVKELLMKSHFMQQLKEATQPAGLHPFQLLINILGLTIFPFVGKPILELVGELKPADFNALVQQRKKLIPAWIKLILETK